MAKKEQCPATVDESISVAWSSLKGFKGPFWWMFVKVFVLAMAISAVVFLAVGVSPFSGLIGHAAHENVSPMAALQHQGLIQLISEGLKCVLAAVMATVYMLGVKRMLGREIRKQRLFEYMPRFFSLLVLSLLYALVFNLAMIVSNILIALHMGVAGLVAFGVLSIVQFVVLIALLPASIIAVPLLIEQKLSAWDAFVQSIKLSLPIWPKLFLITLFAILVSIFGVVLLLIGTIWFLPYATLLYASVYTVTKAHHKL